MLTFHPDEDLFRSGADVLVNTVNCVGVMGGGLAATFKDRFPSMFEDYRLSCLRGEVTPGKMHVWYSTAPISIVNFPTKKHWRDPSELEWITTGLVDLVAILRNQAVAPWPVISVAVPMLGCGLGGLVWDEVGPEVVRAFRALGSWHIGIYGPDPG